MQRYRIDAERDRAADMSHRIRVIDTHTAGEPTRIMLEGGPDLGEGSMSQLRDVFRDRFDSYRSAVVNEPRGYEAIVGAALCTPTDPTCTTGVIFFNNVGYLEMCGHGIIGLAVALVHLGRIRPGAHRFETPVGVVDARMDGANEVSIENVPSYRHAKDITVDVEDLGPITGDVAWGGNWFFLVNEHGQELKIANVEHLSKVASRIRQALRRAGVTGAAGEEVDHIELFGPPTDPEANSRNFVLCPGREYDRSPCGTGTSAKLACLVADGKLGEGEVWRQEGIVGKSFEGSVRLESGRIIPSIRSSAYVTAESTLILDPNDPFRMGLQK